MIINRFNYSARTPKVISNTVSNADEINRWILDLQGIAFYDERHAPGLHIRPSNKVSGQVEGIANNPVYISTDTLTWGKDGFFKYIQGRSASEFSLLPSDPDLRSEAEELYHYFWEDLWRPVGRYVYSLILDHKEIAFPLVTRQVPFWEKLIYQLFYTKMAAAIRKGLKINEYSNDQLLAAIERGFSKAEELLSDGRNYLVGDKLSIADLFFAVVVAPLVLPPEFSGSIAKLEDYPAELQSKVDEFRKRPGGQFVLRLFKVHRLQPYKTRILKRESIFKRTKARLGAWLFGPRFFTRLFRLLARFPVLKFGKNVIFTGYQTVRDILEQDERFTIKEINAGKMNALDLNFFLGMDRSPQHDREKGIMMEIVKHDDLSRIRKFIRNEANDLIARTAPFEKVDVVSSVTRPVLIRLLDDYFGVPMPNEAIGMQWMRDLFYDLFLNLNDDQKIHEFAIESSNGLKEWLFSLIAKRKSELAKGEQLKDNLLNRLLLIQHEGKYDWLDDDTIRRNISGLIIGAVDTISKAVVLALDELFRRPRELQEVKAAAYLGDTNTVKRYVYEALRFNPFNPIVMRFAQTDQQVTVTGKKKPVKIKAGSKVFAALAPAMFDKTIFEKPKSFDPNREVKYLHFGDGYHECYGKHINAVVIPEFVAAFLRLTNVRYSKRFPKKGLYEGPFPNNFVLDYDFNAF